VEPKRRAPTLRIITSMVGPGSETITLRSSLPQSIRTTQNDHRKPRAQRFSVHLLALRGALLLRPRILFDTQFPRGAQGASEYILARFRQSNMGRSHPSPSAGNGQKDLRQLLDKFLLQFRRKHQVAVALFSDASVAKILPPTRKSAAPCASLRLRLRGSKQSGENQTLSSSYHSLVVPFSGRPACASRALRVEPRRHRLQQSSGGFPGMAGGKLAAQFDYGKLRASVAEGLRRGRGRNQAGPANKRSNRVTRIRIRASLMRPLVCTSYPAPRNSSRK